MTEKPLPIQPLPKTQRSHNAFYVCPECGDKYPHIEEARLCCRIDRLEHKTLPELLEKAKP